MIASHGREDEALWGLQGVLVVFCLSGEPRPSVVRSRPLTCGHRFDWISIRQEGEAALFSGWRIHGLKRRRSGNQYFRLQYPAFDS